jgi:general L-amino acid transport system permease protein
MSDLQAQTDLNFVRAQMVAEAPAPRSAVGPIAWLRTNLFASVGDTILTLVALALIFLAVPPLINWAFISAAWDGPDRSVCTPTDVGACWAFVKAKFAQFIYGRYPVAERWRVDLVFLLGAAGLIPFAIPSVPYKNWNLLYLFIVFPVIALVLLAGGNFGLPHVETALWGGLLVTLVVSYVGIFASLPLGILLALGRRSQMPVVRTLCIAFIEFWRGVPLITVLFMASVMLPLFTPAGMSFDKLLRALIGVSLFSAAYMAENIRGGLQAIPKGQYEAAQALGLGYWRMMRLIVLPQALKLVIPGIVNTFISLLKDTSLVYIIGLFDLLGIVRLNFTDTNWASWQTPATGLVFAAFIFWLMCFSISRYSQFLERRLNTGHKR